MREIVRAPPIGRDDLHGSCDMKCTEAPFAAIGVVLAVAMSLSAGQLSARDADVPPVTSTRFERSPLDAQPVECATASARVHKPSKSLDRLCKFTRQLPETA